MTGAPFATKCRVVNVGKKAFTLVEVSDIDSVLADAIDHERPTPYGAVTWTSAIPIAVRVMELCNENMRVLDVGVGTGLVSCAARSCGAQVLGVDIDAVALDLAARSAHANELEIDLAYFDVTSSESLPDADLVVIADLLYEDELAIHVARRVVEAARRGSFVLVGDPVRRGRAAFCAALGQEKLPNTFVDAIITPPGEAPQRVGMLEIPR